MEQRIILKEPESSVETTMPGHEQYADTHIHVAFAHGLTSDQKKDIIDEIHIAVGKILKEKN